MKPFFPSLLRSLALATIALALAGCATPPAGPEDAVHARAQERWQAMLKNDFPRAWTYATPAYRAIHPAEKYYSARGTAVVWKNATVLQVQCPAADKCTAKVRLDAEAFGMPKSLREISTVLDETWLLEDGQWWYFEKL